MKTLNLIKWTVLLIMIVGSFSSCTLQNHGPELVAYNLLLNHTDISGNDLVKDFTEVDSNPSLLYKLEIVLPEPCDNWNNESYNVKDGDTASPPVSYRFFDGHNYFATYIQIPVDGCPTTKMITHKIKCPELFGDDAVREIVSYWNVPKGKAKWHYAKCYLIEFEGKAITPTPIDQEQVYISLL